MEIYGQVAPVFLGTAPPRGWRRCTAGHGTATNHGRGSDAGSSRVRAGCRASAYDGDREGYPDLHRSSGALASGHEHRTRACGGAANSGRPEASGDNCSNCLPRRDRHVHCSRSRHDRDHHGARNASDDCGGKPRTSSVRNTLSSQVSSYRSTFWAKVKSQTSCRKQQQAENDVSLTCAKCLNAMKVNRTLRCKKGKSDCRLCRSRANLHVFCQGNIGHVSNCTGLRCRSQVEADAGL